MLPTFSIYNQRKQAVANTKLFCYGNVIATSLVTYGANLQNLTRCKFRSAVLRTRQGSTLYRHVTQIVHLSSFKQMCWIAARRVIASMADIQNRPTLISEKVGQSMSGGMSVLGTKLPVASLSYAFQPDPTCTFGAVAGSFINVAPEPLSFLFSKDVRVSINSNHRENLHHRFELWLGSFGCLPHSFEPFHCNTRLV